MIKILTLMALSTLVFSCHLTSGHPLQTLQNKPGYIAVYIRHGDEPLAEINPALAEAFHEEVKSSTDAVGQTSAPIFEGLLAYDKLENLLDSVDKGPGRHLMI